MVWRTKVILCLGVAAFMSLSTMMGVFTPIAYTVRMTARQTFVLHFYDTRLRVLWLRSPDADIVVRHDPNLPILRVQPATEEEAEAFRMAQQEGHQGVVWYGAIRLGTRRTVTDFAIQLNVPVAVMASGAPMQRVTLLRLPAWIPTGLLLLYPVVAVLRGPVRIRRRRRHNRCVACGYDLTGNTTGRCPECGDPLEHAGLEASPKRTE